MTVRLAHLTDLHFGEDVPGLAERLADDIRAHAPHAVVVSGDLTWRARPAELAATWTFLEGFGVPVLAVPGNHDIPAANVWARFVHPRRAWLVGAPPAAVLQLGEVTIIGLDTVTRAQWHLDWSAGAISEERRMRLARALRAASPTSVVVCHHPLVHPAGAADRRVPRGAAETVALLRLAGVRAVLCGHLHRAEVVPLGDPWPVQLLAPSALSPRGDGTANGWLLVEVGCGLRATLRQFVAGRWVERVLFSLP